MKTLTMEKVLQRYVSQRIFSLFLLLIVFTGISESRNPERTRAALLEEMHTLEEKAVEIIADEFGDDLEIKILTENYRTADEDDGKSITWMALTIYVKLTLIPKLKVQTTNQAKALKNFGELEEKHTELEQKYERSKE